MTKFRNLLLCMLSGGLLVIAFPPLSQSFFIWVALTPLFAVLWRRQQSSGIKKHFVNAFYGYVFGLVYFGGVFWWINEVSTLGYIPLTLYLSLFPALWAILAGGPFHPQREPYPGLDPKIKLGKRKRDQWSYRDMGKTTLSAIFAASSWVCVEWLRGYGEVSFGWNYLGTGIHLSMAQPAEWIGGVGLSLFPVFVAAVLWSVGSRIYTTIICDGKRSVQWDFIVTMTLLALIFIWGSQRTVHLHKNQASLPLSTLIIQENTPQFIKWDAEKMSENFSGYMQATYDAVTSLEEQSLARAVETGEPSRRHKPQWVIWPESALTWPLFRWEGERRPPSDQAIAQISDIYWRELSEDIGPLTLISGLMEVFRDFESGDVTRVYNSLFVFEGAFDEKQTVYRKKHLVPFGEFIPFRETFPILEKGFAFSYGSPMGANMQRGEGSKPLTIKTSGIDVQVIPTICFEDTVSYLLRPYISTTGPQVILNITNDGWFNKSGANEQHYRNARLRAIELRRPLIRAANTGISAIVGMDGYAADPKYKDEGIRELRDEGGSPFIKGQLFGTVDLPLNPELTLYAKWGDWFVVQCLLLSLFGLMRPILKHSFRQGNIRDGVYIPAHRQKREEQHSS